MIVQNNISDVLNSDISCEARVGVIDGKSHKAKDNRIILMYCLYLPTWNTDTQPKAKAKKKTSLSRRGDTNRQLVNAFPCKLN